LLISESKTTEVWKQIARAKAAPHTNADGMTALERFATPL